MNVKNVQLAKAQKYFYSIIISATTFYKDILNVKRRFIASAQQKSVGSHCW